MDNSFLDLLNCTDQDEINRFYKQAGKVKQENVGNVVYYRGLVEFSNRCYKNCLYCGLRAENKELKRYSMTDEEILEAVRFAYVNRYASIVLQAGEDKSEQFVKRITNLVREIKKSTNEGIGITLSCGEQSVKVYEEWFKAGAHRYLLRIETSSENLYNKIHPLDETHGFSTRIKCLENLKDIGYQVGSGMMVGLPEQTTNDIFNDIKFLKEFDVDMVGLGPYIEHSDTPLFALKNELLSLQQRLELTLKTIAILRLTMKDINIAAATALQVIEFNGRERAIEVGANVIMPNITPTKYRKDYFLYENKPCIDEGPEHCLKCLEQRILAIGNTIGYDQWGDSKHFLKKRQEPVS